MRKIRATKFLPTQMQFSKYLEFPETDFRQHYRGTTNGSLMHGKGMLVLRGGKIYPGTFVKNVISEYESDLAIEEKHWALQKEMKKMQEMQLLAQMK